MGARRLISLILSGLCVLLGLLAVSGAPARAALLHEYESQITEIPANGPQGKVPSSGPLNPSSLLADAGDLYVSDGRVDVFDASTDGFVSQLPLPDVSAIGRATGETEAYTAGGYAGGDYTGVSVYGAGVCGSLECAVLQQEWTGADTPSGSFGLFRGVAVDESASVSDWAKGDVLVASLRPNVVDVFKPVVGGGEKYVTQLEGTSPGEPFEAPQKIAVSGFNGDLLVVDDRPGHGDEAVELFEPVGLNEYAFVGQLTVGGESFSTAGSVAVNAANGEIYVVGKLSGDATAEQAVFEFSATGEFLGVIHGGETPAGGFDELTSVAVDSASGRVFVGALQESALPEEPPVAVVDVFGGDVVAPDVVSTAASGLTASSVTLNGTVNPVGAGVATCEFQWGTTPSFGHTVACEAVVPDGSGAVSVKARIAGLQPDSTYYYRLQASNAHGTNPGLVSQDMSVTTLGPGLHGESVSGIASTSVTLGAQVDPHGASSTYFFQYGTSGSYGSQAPSASELAPHGALLGSGEGDVQPSQHVQGLQPFTLYHYRVVVFSEIVPGSGVLEEFVGPDQVFRTQVLGGSLVLPDGRAWEQVSPVDKHGASVLRAGAQLYEPFVASTPGGDAFTFMTSAPTEDLPAGFVFGVQVLARHGAGGWSSSDLATPRAKPAGLELSHGNEYMVFSEDLSLGLLERGENAREFSPLSSLASEPTLYLHQQKVCEADPSSGECYLPLVTGKEGYADVPPGTKFGTGSGPEPYEYGVQFEGATPDLKHVVFKSTNKGPLTTTPSGFYQLYEWSADEPPAARLQLISQRPVNETDGEEPSLGGRVVKGTDRRGAISSDGNRVFWTAGEYSAYGLYVRDVAKQETLRIDVPEAGVVLRHEGETHTIFESATSDGSKVFFMDDQRLTSSAGARNRGYSLYECDIVEGAGRLKCDLTDLTPHSSTGYANVEGVPGVTADGSYVYFVAQGVFAVGAERGEPNLYLDHAGRISLIAVLSSQDGSSWAGEYFGLSGLDARVSPDGRFFAFTSDRSLTGYDNRDALTGEPDEEAYLYDAQTSRLVCASCDPTGGRPVGLGSSSAGLPSWTKVGYAGKLGSNIPYQPRYLSDDGRLFFESVDALVPQDINGTQDVYEYEPAGVGDCDTSKVTFSDVSGGCVGLISSGTSAAESVFMDASETGDDVFFLTREKLVSGDLDTAYDVYDAHVCMSGWSCTSSSTVPPACTTADACRAAPSPQPSLFGSPASSTFTGAGNVTQGGTVPVAKQRSLTRTQRLKLALRACQKKHGKRKRTVCKQQAHKRYRAVRSGKSNVKGRG